MKLSDLQPRVVRLLDPLKPETPKQQRVSMDRAEYLRQWRAANRDRSKKYRKDYWERQKNADHQRAHVAKQVSGEGET